MKEFLSKCVVWQNPDGSLQSTYFVADGMRISVTFPNGKVKEMTWDIFKKIYSASFREKCVVQPLETEDEFIERATQEAILHDPYQVLKDLPRMVIEVSDIPAANATERRRCRIKNEKIEIDHSVKTDGEIIEEKRVAIRQELISKGLSDATADAIVKGGA